MDLRASGNRIGVAGRALTRHPARVFAALKELGVEIQCGGGRIFERPTSFLKAPNRAIRGVCRVA